MVYYFIITVWHEYGILFYINSWHASCTLSGNRIMMHGGYDGDLALDDVHIFTLGMDKLYIARN